MRPQKVCGIDLQLAAQGRHPADAVFRGGVRPAGEQARDLFIAAQGLAANGGGETVYVAECGVGERHAPQQAHPRHFHARLAFAPVLPDARQGGGGAASALYANQVGHRVGPRGDVGLDALCERVETGGGGDGTRQIEREFRSTVVASGGRN
jgi:hypothetical protein